MDVASGTGYTVPADNPFVGRTDARPEVWSYGLRNPWRFSFDPATGDLYIADVGQNAWEEVDVVTAADGAGRGANFGWNVTEGRHCYASASCDLCRFTLPCWNTRTTRAARSPAATSIGALPFPRCRGIISTPTTARAGSAASGWRTARRWSPTSGPPWRPAAR